MRSTCKGACVVVLSGMVSVSSNQFYYPVGIIAGCTDHVRLSVEK